MGLKDKYYEFKDKHFRKDFLFPITILRGREKIVLRRKFIKYLKENVTRIIIIQNILSLMSNMRNVYIGK